MNRILSYAALLIALITVPACKTLVPAPPVEVATPADLKVRCPDLEPIEDPATLGAVLKYITYLQQQYTDCAIRSDSKNEALNTPKK